MSMLRRRSKIWLAVTVWLMALLVPMRLGRCDPQPEAEAGGQLPANDAAVAPAPEGVITTGAADEPGAPAAKGPRPGIGLCLSGGGYRAMLFHVGVLWRLNELGYLPKLDRISSVSGGSITAGALAVGWSGLRF